jgi:hypothetical protein
MPGPLGLNNHTVKRSSSIPRLRNFSTITRQVGITFPRMVKVPPRSRTSSPQQCRSPLWTIRLQRFDEVALCPSAEKQKNRWRIALAPRTTFCNLEVYDACLLFWALI